MTYIGSYKKIPLRHRHSSVVVSDLQGTSSETVYLGLVSLFSVHDASSGEGGSEAERAEQRVKKEQF